MLKKKNIKYLLLLTICFCSASPAQYFSSFGINKVQYDEFNWKIIRTDHFDIYYYNEFQEISQIGAKIAESTYEEYKVRFNTLINSRIPLIFYNTSLQFQQTNTTSGLIPDAVGGFFEFLKGRVVIPYTGSLAAFKHVIRHELAHVFMTNKVARVLHDHRTTDANFPPLWYTEGFAEFISTSPDAQAEMVVRDALFNNYFVNLDNIFKISGTFLMYKEGQNFLEFVKEKFGYEKVMQMIDNIWMYSRFTKVVEFTLGESLEQIDSEWEYYLKQKYYPMLKTTTPLDIIASKVTNFGFNYSPIPYKIDGKQYIYFVANRTGYSSLYRVELAKENDEQKEPELVVQGEKKEEFEAFHLLQSTIDISKNGIIAFVTKVGARDAIHFFSIEENDVIKTFKKNDLINIISPKFSSDGNKVVFQAIDKKGFSDIYLLDVQTFDLTRLTNDYYDDKDPVFGVNDNQVVFSSDRTAGEYSKTYNLFTYSLLSHKIDYLTYIDSDISTPILSKDKTKLLFTGETEKVKNIYLMNISSAGNYSDTLTQITNVITGAYSPEFLDSTEIVFAGFQDYSFNIYRMNYKKIVEDTSAKKIQMNFNYASGKWIQEVLTPEAVNEKLNYENQYTLDYAQSQITTDPIFGTQGGATVLLSDLLGDDNYFFTLYNNAQVQSEFFNSFNIMLERINLRKRTNFGYGVFHFTGNRYDIRESEEFYFERSFGAFFVLNFPLSKFERIETSVTVANSDKQLSAGLYERKALLLSNSLSYVFDNSLWGPTGPLDGTRARLLLAYTGDVKYSNVNYYTIIADLRHYIRLTYRSAFAVRAALFYNDGKEARRFFMGGSWDLRGWPRFSIRGEKMWLSSVEYRFPLLDQLKLRFPFVNLDFYGFRGALFMDAGGAWDTQYKETLGSIGVGVRFNLFNAIVLRYDIGKKIEKNFSEIQSGLFYQFFFGWDF